MGLGTRREARERALSLLYEAEAKGMSPTALLDEQPAPPLDFAVELVTGVATHQARIDGLIQRYAVDWALDRMPAVDRNVLRLGIFELAERPETPVGVVISEAVELAKQYSTEDSSRFVNGVLSAVAGELRAA